MCGRYVAPDEAAMERFWRIDRRNNRNPFRKRFNVAPTTMVPIFLLGPEGEHILTEARWGLIPAWWKKQTPPSLTFNARSEEASSKPTWRDSLRHHRCLMPAYGWYEWCESEPVRSSIGRKVNQPYFLRCPDDPVIAFAGLWSTWIAPDGHAVESCALLSREAAPSIRAIHHRMPAVLAPNQFEEWLNPEAQPDQIASLLQNARHDLVGYRVSLCVNTPRNDYPNLINEVSPQSDLLSDNAHEDNPGHI